MNGTVIDLLIAVDENHTPASADAPIFDAPRDADIWGLYAAQGTEDDIKVDVILQGVSYYDALESAATLYGYGGYSWPPIGVDETT